MRGIQIAKTKIKMMPKMERIPISNPNHSSFTFYLMFSLLAQPHFLFSENCVCVIGERGGMRMDVEERICS